MKQHMMTHKNRDGTPISVELLNSVNADRSRSRSSNSSATSLIVKDSSNKSNSSDDFNPHGHHLPPPPPPPISSSAAAGQPIDSSRRPNNLAAMMMLNPTPASLKEHCLSLTIQHSHDRNGGPLHHDGLPLKEQNNAIASELLLAQQQQLLNHQRGTSHRGQHSARSTSSSKKRGKSTTTFIRRYWQLCWLIRVCCCVDIANQSGDNFGRDLNVIGAPISSTQRPGDDQAHRRRRRSSGSSGSSSSISPAQLAVAVEQRVSALPGSGPGTQQHLSHLHPSPPPPPYRVHGSATAARRTALPVPAGPLPERYWNLDQKQSGTLSGWNLVWTGRLF